MVHYWIHETWREYNCLEWWMLRDSNNYFRRVRTYQEIKSNSMIDEEANEYGYRPTRGNRKKRYLDAWNDFGITCHTTKSWKKIYRKKRRQYDKVEIKNTDIKFQDNECNELMVCE